MASTEVKTPEERARQRAKDLTDLLWHTGAYVIVNAFLWAMDLVQGGGLEWAYWVTIPWGLGLAFHALAYWIDGRQVEERKYEEYLNQD